MENLWPIDFGEIPEKTPVAILREQGRALGERTSNIVVGRVETERTGDEKFAHVFTLYCSPLGVTLHFLCVYHAVVNVYPTEIQVLGDQTPLLRAATPEEFAGHLKEIFSRDKTKKTIASLLAQSKQ
jgi:hypothetical protein